MTGGEIKMAVDALEFALSFGGEDGLPGVADARSALAKLRCALSELSESCGDGQRCDNCGGPDDLVWFCHDPKLWEKVTGNSKPLGTENAKGLWCVRCFNERCHELGIWVEWAPMNLRHLAMSTDPNETQPSDSKKCGTRKPASAGKDTP